MFTLHSQLAADCLPLGKLSLCQLLLMNNATFPWLILVPERENIREIYELSEADQILLTQEISAVAKTLQNITSAHKMNMAALGNQVPQLHIHIIARFQNDTAWPKPVWSVQNPANPYSSEQLEGFKNKLSTALPNITKM